MAGQTAPSKRLPAHARQTTMSQRGKVCLACIRKTCQFRGKPFWCEEQLKAKQP